MIVAPPACCLYLHFSAYEGDALPDPEQSQSGAAGLGPRKDGGRGLILGLSRDACLHRSLFLKLRPM